MGDIIITGGCGFIGHHFVEHFLKYSDHRIIIFDKLTYAASGFDRVRDIEAFDNDRVQFFTVDITQPIPPGVVQETKEVKHILHLAAESHVDNSIVDAVPFVLSNVLGTTNLLEYARGLEKLDSFLYFGTDEVFGPAAANFRGNIDPSTCGNHYAYKEWARYKSANPYAASKAGGEEMCLAYHNTHRVPVVITHTMNCFGERQHPEKYIPKIIQAGMTGKPVTVHAYPDLKKAGSRYYIHCRNVAKVCHKIMEHGVIGEKYNIVGEKEVDNAHLVDMVSFMMNKPIEKEYVNFHESRPGHDLRYALDGKKVKGLFSAEAWDLMPFERSLFSTVRWYMDHLDWLFLK